MAEKKLPPKKCARCGKSCEKKTVVYRTSSCSKMTEIEALSNTPVYPLVDPLEILH